MPTRRVRCAHRSSAVLSAGRSSSSGWMSGHDLVGSRLVFSCQSHFFFSVSASRRRGASAAWNRASSAAAALALAAAAALADLYIMGTFFLGGGVGGGPSHAAGGRSEATRTPLPEAAATAATRLSMACA